MSILKYLLAYLENLFLLLNFECYTWSYQNYLLMIRKLINVIDGPWKYHYWKIISEYKQVNKIQYSVTYIISFDRYWCVTVQKWPQPVKLIFGSKLIRIFSETSYSCPIMWAVIGCYKSPCIIAVIANKTVFSSYSAYYKWWQTQLPLYRPNR